MTNNELAQYYFGKDYSQLRNDQQKIVNTQMAMYYTEDAARSEKDYQPLHPDNQ
jgi:hypothetical protein